MRLAVDADRCNRLRGAGIRAGRTDGQQVALAQRQVHAREARRMQQQLAGARHRRIQADGAEHVPGRHRAEVVIAGDAVGRVGEQGLRGAHDGRGLPRLAEQRVHPRRVQVGLVVRVVAELVVVAVRPDHPMRARAAPHVLREFVLGEERIQPACAPARVPPIAATRPGTSCCTSHWYCQAVPSWNPWLERGS
jgi:hypothetical protein